jgi:uncharacterized Zn finger protein
MSSNITAVVRNNQIECPICSRTIKNPLTDYVIYGRVHCYECGNILTLLPENPEAVEEALRTITQWEAKILRVSSIASLKGDSFIIRNNRPNVMASFVKLGIAIHFRGYQYQLTEVGKFVLGRLNQMRSI